MSQYPLLGIMPDSDGATFRSGINSALKAILSGNSGPNEPDSNTLEPFMEWWDTSTGIIKRRNESNTAWISESYFDGSSVTPISTSGFSTGDVLLTIEATQPSGWLFCDSKTMGNASSGAVYASTTYQSLYYFVWANISNTWAPMYNSGGSSVSRGASAAADWASNNRLSLPDYRGCALTVKDNLGGSSANRITSASTNGAYASSLGGRGGTETETLTTNQIPSHNHTGSSNGSEAAHTHSVGSILKLGGGTYWIGSQYSPSSTDTAIQAGSATTGAGSSHTHSQTIASQGGGQAHSNTMPFGTINIKIKI